MYRKSVKLLLLVFVAMSVLYLIVEQARHKQASTAPTFPPDAAISAENTKAAEPTQAQQQQKVLVYYFYTTVRCPTCRKIEAFSGEALRQAFSGALGSGLLEWHPLNVQLPENRHFIEDYQLFTKSLVVVRVKDGRQMEWKNLEKVWELVGNKAIFMKYVQDEVREYLRKS
jgi:predicted DCC family thiol-disulfide oxidoreductase YuxK